MTFKLPGYLAAAIAGVVLLGVSVAPVSGQKKAFMVAKGWYNQPDLQGIWMPAKPVVTTWEKGGFIKDPANHKIPVFGGRRGPGAKRT